MKRWIGPPKSVTAGGLWNPFRGTKKYTIVCGKCAHTYNDKLPIAEDLASSICPCCGGRNYWSHTGFMRWYNNRLEANEGKTLYDSRMEEYEDDK